MILLPDKENEFIYETFVTPKDNELLSLIERPNDISVYDYAFKQSESEELYKQIPKNTFNVVSDYFPSRIRECLNEGETHHWNYYRKTVNTYVNPLHLSYNEVKKICSSSKVPLLELFNKFRIFDRNRELEILEYASNMIKRLQDSSLDNEIVAEIIQKLWPKFGYFATHMYDNLEFVANNDSRQYEVQTLIDAKTRLLYCENNCIILIETQRKDFMRKVSIKNEAEDNVKVLSLAKSVNDRIGSNR